MLRQSTAIALTIALAALAGCNSKSETKSQTRRVRILATTDEHSHVLAAAPERDEWPLASTARTSGTVELKGGIARRATALERERADGVPTVVLSNGDYTQGALAAVGYTVANFDAMLMKKLGYDAVALGNHEFDLGGTLAASAVEKTLGGAPQFVISNAHVTGTTGFAAVYGDVGSGKPIVKGLVVDKGGVKVGVVSALGPSAAYDVQIQAAPVTFTSAGAVARHPDTTSAKLIAQGDIQPAVDKLRAAGAEVVVLLFHGGLYTAAAPNGDVNLVVPLLHGVDLVVTGHTHETRDATTLLADADARQVPVMQPAAFGNELIRAEFTVTDGAVAFDTAREAFLPVDDRLVPTFDAEIRYALSTTINGIESSFLPGTLSLVTGAPVYDNAYVTGDLYFYTLGTTAFDVTGSTLPRETNALNLDTDAMLAVTNGLGVTATVALQNAGSIRGDLAKGKTGEIAFADVFRMVSLGGDPVEGTPGFPLLVAYIPAMELRAAFEQTLQLSFLNNDYYLGEAGLSIQWDPSATACASSAACALGPGWITSLQVAGDAAPIYTSTGGWTGVAVPALGGAGADALRRIPVVTTYLVAGFAGSMGIHLYANATDALPTADPASLIVKWPITGTPHLKDHQALASYIAGLGAIPAAYGATAASRVVCTLPAGCPAGSK